MGTPGYVDINGACIMLAIASRRFKDYSHFSVEYHFLDVAGLASRQIVTFDQAREVWPTLRDRAVRVYSAIQFPAEPGNHCAFCPFSPECWPQIEPKYWQQAETEFDELDNLFA